MLWSEKAMSPYFLPAEISKKRKQDQLDLTTIWVTWRSPERDKCWFNGLFIVDEYFHKAFTDSHSKSNFSRPVINLWVNYPFFSSICQKKHLRSSSIFPRFALAKPFWTVDVRQSSVWNLLYRKAFHCDTHLSSWTSRGSAVNKVTGKQGQGCFSCS